MKHKFKILISVAILIIVVAITLVFVLPSLTGSTIKDIQGFEDVDFENDCIELDNGHYRCFLGTMNVESGDTSLEDFDVSMDKDKKDKDKKDKDKNKS